MQSLINFLQQSRPMAASNMDIWSWICELPNSEEWSSESTTALVLPLATSNPTRANNSTNSIQLRAEKSLVPNSPSSSEPSTVSVTFSVCSMVTTDDIVSSTTLWVSDRCDLNSEKPFLPVVLQLLQEIMSRSPNSHESTTCPRSQLQKLNSDPISWILDSHSSESFSSFFNLIFLTRLFWICACDASSEVGSLYFHSILAPNLESISCRHHNSPVLRTFFISVGTDVELCFMRTFGYMLAKWLILKEVTGVGAGLKSLTPVLLPSPSGFSYAMESHGLWILKGYAPVKAMKCLWSDGGHKSKIGGNFPMIEAKETVLKYVLGHQQLEAVIQMEYTVGFYDGYIQVHARVDNIRLHVVKLGFKKNDVDDGFLDEKYFPSRARVWVGPEIGANYLSGLSLGRATDNVEKEVEVEKILKGTDFGKSNKTPDVKVKAKARMATKTKLKNWRWDQDVEGNAAIYDAVLCDNTTGNEIATWRPSSGGGVSNNNSNFMRTFKGGASKAFTKSGGVIFTSGDGEWKDGVVGWRLNKEMEGSVLKWRIGGQVWLTYWPNDIIKTSYNETRFVEWCDEVDLPLIPGKRSC